MNNQEKNTFVRKRITETLLEIMETEDFADIAISSLTEKAGVGRASFYRNFESKEDVLKQESDRLTGQWGQEFESNPASTADTIFVSLLDFYQKHSRFYTALYRANLSHIMLDTIVEKIGITPEMPNGPAYFHSFLAYGIYGWIIEWVKRGMQESGTELHEMFHPELPQSDKP